MNSPALHPDTAAQQKTGEGDDPLSRRSSGVLLHISSLPSRFGIGDLGSEAFRFADRLHASEQTFWQILPLTPSNPVAGESPYFSSSAFAGNPLLIDPDSLVQEGLLLENEVQGLADAPEHEVDFTRTRSHKLGLLELAERRFTARGTSEDFSAFCEREAYWLEDYALFSALQEDNPGASWSEWEASLRDRQPDAIARAQEQHADTVHRHKVWQFFFSRQWEALKNYCNSLGILIFGDMPIYVSYESADVWSHPEIFKLDDQRRPTMVSGVPPDYFSATGQLWNNPVYDWAALRATDYRWWIERMGALFNRYDVVRIDHFRGLVQFWEVPAGSETAINGSWQDVPTYEFFDRLLAAYPHFPVVVEDLGIITPDVVDVKNHYGLPGMLILQFAFGEDGDHNPYLPSNHPEAALVYVGTHDNDTAQGWLTEADEQTRRRLAEHLDCADRNAEVRDIIDLAMSSKANIAVITAQDLLGLPSRARMNNPAHTFGNWSWRLSQDEFDALPMRQLAEATRRHHRSNRAAALGKSTRSDCS